MNAIPTGRELADVVCQRIHQLERTASLYRGYAIMVSAVLVLLLATGRIG